MLEEIKKLLAEEGKEEQELLDTLRGKFVNAEAVEAFLETDEGRRLLQPRLDRYFAKGLKTWQENNLEKEVQARVEAKIKELYPDETPEGKKLRELEKKIEEAERRRIQSELKSLVTTEAHAKGLPVELAQFAVAGDEETTRENLAKIEAVFKAAVQEAVKAKFKDLGRDVEPGEKEPSDFSKMSMAEYVARREKEGIKK